MTIESKGIYVQLNGHNSGPSLKVHCFIKTGLATLAHYITQRTNKTDYQNEKALKGNGSNQVCRPPLSEPVLSCRAA